MAAAFLAIFGDIFSDSDSDSSDSFVSDSDDSNEDVEPVEPPQEPQNNHVEPSVQVPFELHHISERALLQRTRLDRRVFTYVHDLVAPALMRNTRRGRHPHLTTVQKLYVALQFYATGTYQWLVAGCGQVSQSSASRAIRDVTEALVELASQFVRFPVAGEYDAVKQAFHSFGRTRHGRGFPNVLGAIDSIHIRIKPPTNNPEEYFNPHFYYSINCLLIVGPDLKIFNAFAEYPGSNEDSYVWRNSSVGDALEAGNFTKGWLVGDSGYPQQPWLMTPISNPATDAEHLYNSVHASTRNVVERTSGVLKSRWHCLDSPLAYTPGKVCRITIACCVLHNICTEYNLDVDDLQEDPLPDDHCHEAPNEANSDQARKALIAMHFA